ncbi:MAG: dicarboxylate/amino acid:cation symporter [Mogibacterium sp.]|nr:dicarboxylate/amino acid:cation symporter [Mogibacterium sp.]
MEKIKKSLPLQIFIALALGIVVGLIFLSMGLADFTTEYIKPFGTIFLNLLKFIVVPIVLTSIIQGVVSLSDIKKVGTIGLRTIIYYFCTTAFAIVIGLIFANIFKGSYAVLETSGLEYEAAEPTKFMDTLVNIFPSNFFQPMVDASMLQVIVIALFIGFGIIIAGEKGLGLKNWIDSCYEVFMVIMTGIIKITPIAVFCMMVPVVAVNGPQILGSLALVLLTAYIAYAVHALFTYSLAVSSLGHMNPVKFFKGALPAFLFAFTSTSSIGTLPVTMECAEDLGVRKEVASFTLPLGATINMDGTAIYQGVASIFIATCFGIDLTLGQMATIVLTATLASIGTAGTPGAGMIMLAMVLQSVGLPVEGIALIMGVDKIFDMGRTGVNVVGDLSAAVIVSDYESRRMSKEAKAK